MISLADSQPLKTNLFSSTNNRGFTERYFSDKVHASLMIETALCDGASFRRLTSLIELKNLHQF